MVLTFVDRLGTDPVYAERIQGLKRDLLARPELSASRATSGRTRATFFERSASGETQVLEQYLVRMFVTAGEALAGDAEMRTEINQGLVAVLRTVVAEQKSGVSTFISIR